MLHPDAAHGVCVATQFARGEAREATWRTLCELWVRSIQQSCMADVHRFATASDSWD